jgi:haloacid dehalogenase superfamily, subfamily IA, variant 3 with third motif having DD or ED/haloacid dehalogenase superfamily, subfamily IA, variant 1 with third motif having Dx(3-4)D or Dx(3-4)E
MTPRRYDVVSFDLGSTLVYLNPTRLAMLLADHGVETSPASLLTVEQAARVMTDHPDLIVGRTSDELWRLFLDALLAGVGVSPGPHRHALADLIEQENEDHRLWAHVPPDVPPLLDRLQAAGYRLVVVSNGGGGVRSFLESRGLAGAFEVIIDSFLVGVEKPDPRIFGRALDPLGVPSERALHVGDFYHVDVMGAERAGLTGVLLDPSATRGQGRCPSIRTLVEIEAFLARPASGPRLHGTF